MIIEKLTNELNRAWDDFCLKSDDAWFWHTAGFMRYSQELDSALASTCESFFVKDNNEGVVAICPLFAETVKYNGQTFKEFSFGSYSLPTPALKNGLTKKRREEVMDFIFKNIVRISHEYNVQREKFRFSPLAPSFTVSNIPKFNFLMKYGYLDVSLNTQIIDLSFPLNELWRDVRKGHSCDIKRGNSVLDVIVYDGRNIDENVFESYRQLHYKSRGNKWTRPLSTFKSMYNFIKEGNALLIASRKEGKYIGFSLLLLYKNNAYYGSAANDPDIEYRKLPIAHAMHWTAIQWLKGSGYRFYDIGTQQFEYQLYDIPSEKEVNISHFKRGFGGTAWPFFMGEKFNSEQYFRHVQNQRMENYITTYFKVAAEDKNFEINAK